MDNEIKRIFRKRNEEREQVEYCDSIERAIGIYGGQIERKLGALHNNN